MKLNLGLNLCNVGLFCAFSTFLNKRTHDPKVHNSNTKYKDSSLSNS